MADAVEEDGREQPVGGADRQQVQADRDERDDQRAEGDREDEEADAEHERDHPWCGRRRRVEVVGVLGRLAADVDLRAAAGERPGQDVAAQVAHGRDRGVSDLVAADRHLQHGGPAVRGVHDDARAETRVGGEPALQRDEVARDGGRAHRRRRRSGPGTGSEPGTRAAGRRSPAWRPDVSGSVLTPLAPMCRPSAGIAAASITARAEAEAETRAGAARGSRSPARTAPRLRRCDRRSGRGSAPATR